MNYIEQGTSAFRKTNLALFLAGLVTFAILYSTQPLMPNFSREFGISPAVSSLSLSVTTGTLSVFLLVAATVSESFGRKPIMAFSLLSSALMMILISFSPTFASILILRTLEGIVLAGVPAIAMAYLSEEMNPNSLGIAMGLYISGNTIGGLSGRIFTGLISDWFSWRTAFLTVGILSLLFSILFWVSLPPSTHFRPKTVRWTELRKSLVSFLTDPAFLCLYGIAFLLMGSFVTLYNYIGYLLIEPPYRLSQTLVSFIFVTYLLGTFSSTWMGKLADQYGRRIVLGSGLLLMLLGACVTLGSPLWMRILGLAIFTFGFFGSHSIASAWVGSHAHQNKAHASSLYLLFYYAGSSVGGSLGGIFWSHFEWKGVIGMILVFLGCAWLLTYTLTKLTNSTSER